jgi:glucan biosynthesis protein C
MRPLSHEEPLHRERLHYLDWLRVLAVLGVFYAHTINIFDMYYWHIRQGGQGGESTGLNVLVVFGTQWGMALFFFLAGASACFALASRTSGQFIGERFKRLIIPCIVGFILLSPPQAYLFTISQSHYNGSFLQFYPQFFENMHISWNPQWIGAYGYHLWFLVFLFFVSLLTLPLLLLLKRERGLQFISKLAAFCEKPAGLFVFVVPIALIQIALRAPFPGYQGWADFFIWLFIFVYGFILLADTRFQKAILKQGKIALVVAIISFLTMLVASFAGVLSSWDNITSYTLGYVLYQSLRSILTWSLMIFVLYFGMHLLNASNKVIDYANEAVLPFYILHHPVIVVIAFFTLAWDINMGLKFLIVSTAALIATLLLYDLFIRRINVSRWLFGMKPSHPSRPEQTEESPLHSTPSPQ